MATGHVNEVLRQLRHTGLLPEGGEPTDGQLLERFVRRGDGAALEALVRRHAPMVWGVCRRVLPHHHDAEDAFQATFLVLVRKAASIASRELLANWLYGVAHQTAIKARQTAAKRRAREKQVPDMPDAEALPDVHNTHRDLLPLLDQELTRLPDKYRAALVLCDLEGKTRKEAARQLGLPEGTVASRQARARTLLAKRLARHGPAVSGAALAGQTSAAVPAAVLNSALRAATVAASGQALAGLVSERVASLTEGVLKAMLLTKLKSAAFALLVVGLILFGGLLTHQIVAAQQGPGDVRKVEPRTADRSGDVRRGGPARPATQPAAAHPAAADHLPPPPVADTRPADAVREDQTDEAKAAAQRPLAVTITIEKDAVRVYEQFKVQVRVVNASRTTQSFQVMNGSWEVHWKCSNYQVHWVPRPVFRNFLETVKLEPGQAYEKTGSMFIPPGQLPKAVTFKLGFIPQDGKETYWSNEVTLRVKADGE